MTAFVLCLSVAAGAMAVGGFLIGVSVGEKRERRRPPLRRRSAILSPEILYDAKQNARMWQSIQDRLAVDALMGPSTYEGGE